MTTTDISGGGRTGYLEEGRGEERDGVGGGKREEIRREKKMRRKFENKME